MKQIIFLTAVLAAGVNGYSQTDSSKKQTVKMQLTHTSTTNNPDKLGLQPKNSATAQLPDLKFTGFNVTATAPYMVNGETNYTLNVSYTIKNEGVVQVSAADIIIQGFLTNENWIKQTQDPRFTGMFTAAGGSPLSTLPGEALAPGASRNISYSITNKALAKDPKPVLLLIINYARGPQEITRDNNNAYMTILL